MVGAFEEMARQSGASGAISPFFFKKIKNKNIFRDREQRDSPRCVVHGHATP
jgi:hypothetical protein